MAELDGSAGPSSWRRRRSLADRLNEARTAKRAHTTETPASSSAFVETEEDLVEVEDGMCLDEGQDSVDDWV